MFLPGMIIVYITEYTIRDEWVILYKSVVLHNSNTTYVVFCMVFSYQYSSKIEQSEKNSKKKLVVFRSLFYFGCVLEQKANNCLWNRWWKWNATTVHAPL